MQLASAFSRGFLRHWRGEVSLARAFWLHLVVLSAVGSALSSWLDKSVLPATPLLAGSPRLHAAAGVGLLAASTALTVWQVVGTWRAARVAYAQTGRRLWPFAARVVIVWAVVLGVYTLLGALPTVVALGSQPRPTGFPITKCACFQTGKPSRSPARPDSASHATSRASSTETRRCAPCGFRATEAESGRGGRFAR